MSDKLNVNVNIELGPVLSGFLERTVTAVFNRLEAIRHELLTIEGKVDALQASAADLKLLDALVVQGEALTTRLEAVAAALKALDAQTPATT